MKINWSIGIAGILGFFILFVVFLGIWMSLSPQSLYEMDYYEKGENYATQIQHEISGKEVSLEFSDSLQVLHVFFKEMGNVEQIRLIYLSDNTKDRTILVHEKKQGSKLSLDLGKLNKGLWIFELEGKVGSRSFSKKQQFVL